MRKIREISQEIKGVKGKLNALSDFRSVTNKGQVKKQEGIALLEKRLKDLNLEYKETIATDEDVACVEVMQIQSIVEG